jgi:hypothetical protein
LQVEVHIYRMHTRIYRIYMYTYTVHIYVHTLHIHLHKILSQSGAVLMSVCTSMYIYVYTCSVCIIPVYIYMCIYI